MKRIFRLILCCSVLVSASTTRAQIFETKPLFNSEGFSLLNADDRALDPFSSIAPTLPRIPSGYNYTALGLFCKLDVQFEKRLKFPLFIRLGGDVQRVQEWEGKGSLRKR